MVDFSKLFSLSGTVGSSWNLDGGDVVRTKSALQGLGYYKDADSQRFETPGSGLTPFGSSKMISELVRFQGDNDLKQDGIMHPQGPTH